MGILKKTFLIILILFGSIGQSWATTPKIIPSKDLTYLGAFKMPVVSGYNYLPGDPGGDAMKGLEYDPISGDLIVIMNLSSSNYVRHIAKFSIPTLLTYPNTLTLSNYLAGNTATLTHNPVDIAMGIQEACQEYPSCYTHLGDIHYLGAKGSQTDPKLYWSLYGSYRAANVYKWAHGQFGWAETNLDALGSVGNWRFVDCDPYSSGVGCYAVSGKYLFHAPQSWADTYTGGKSLLEGYSRGGGSSAEGPVIYGFAPWLSCGNDPINCDTDPPPDAGGDYGTGENEPVPDYSLDKVILLQYEGPRFGNMVQDRAVNDMSNGARWIELGSKQAIIFNGTHGLRRWEDNNWSYPSNYYPAAGQYLGCGDSEGYHDDPVSPVLWFYDVDDITAVAQSTKEPYEPQPYKRVELGGYFWHTQRVGLVGGYSYQGIVGMAYDESGGRLFIEEVISPSIQIVHVFSVADSEESTLDTTAPTAPILAIGSVNKNSVILNWNAVTDDSGLPVIYRIYRNDQPIGIQREITYTDNYLAYYPSPVEYRVDAVDFEGNVASSNIISIDGSVGGNVPMKIYIPAYSWPATHETGRINFRINILNSVPMGIRGGTSPYTWSISDFPGTLSIDPDTGIISGTPTSVFGGKGQVIVEDSLGNFAKIKVSINVASSGSWYNDRDQDGVNDVAVGGTDTDDLNSESTPGLTPTQPPATGLTIDGYTANSVSLSWTKAIDRTDAVAYSGGYRADQIGLDICYVVYHGTETGVYPDSIFVGRALDYIWEGLSSGTHYFAVKAVEFRNLESGYTSEVNQILGEGETTLNGMAYGAYHSEAGDEKYRLVETSDGGIAMVSWSSSYAWLSGPGGEVRRTILLKTDSSGIEQWRKIIGPEGYSIITKQNGTTTHHAGSGIIQSGTDLIIIGYKGSAGLGYDGYMMKFTSDGINIWDRTFDGVTSGNDYLRDIVEKTGGGFAIVGYARGSSYDSDGWLILTDSDGLNPTYHYYNTNGLTQEYLSCIRKTSDGGYILAGWTDYDGLHEDYYVVKVTSDGTQSWAQKYDNSERRDKATSIEEDASGNFWIFGRSQVAEEETTSIWIVKVNSSGVLQTTYSISGSENQAYIPKSTIKLVSGNFKIFGYTNVTSGAGYDGYITEINTSGEVQGTPTTIGADSGYNEDYLQNAILSADTNYYYVVGSNNGAFSTYYDLWLLKLAVSDLAVQNTKSCPSKTTYYYDKDLDGLGNNNQWTPDTADCCFAMPGYVLDHTDNDDSNVPKFIFGSGSIMEVGLGGNLAIQ